MDTNKMREDLPSLVKQSIEAHPGYAEFVAWCEGQLIHPYPICFLIWQASREAVVVNLNTCAAEVYDGSGNLDFTKVVEVIEAAGLKVAP